MSEHDGMPDQNPLSHLDGLDEQEFRRAVRQDYAEVEIDLVLALVSAMPVAIWAAGGARDGYAVRLWSRGAEELYGFSTEEVMGENYLQKFVNPMEVRQAEADHVEVERTGNYYRNLARDVIRDDTTRLLLTQGLRVWHPVLREFMQGEIGIDVAEVPTRDREWLQEVLTPESLVQLLRGFSRANQVASSLPHVASELTQLVRTFEGRGANVEFFLTTKLGRMQRLEVVETPGSHQVGDASSASLLPSRDPEKVVEWCQATGRDFLLVAADGEGTPKPTGKERGFPRPRSGIVDPGVPFAVRLIRFGNVVRGGLVIYLPPGARFSNLAPSLCEMLEGVMQLSIVLDDRLNEKVVQLERTAVERERQATRRLARQYRHAIQKKAHLLRMYSGVVSEYALGTAEIEDLSGIANGLESMATSIEERAENFRDKLVEESFHLEDVLSSVTGEIMMLYPGVVLHRDVRSDATVRAVRPFLEDAFENILTNAVEAMEFGGRCGVFLTEISRGSPHVQHHVEVRISDDGPGMSEELLRSWGEPGASTKEGRRGNGLALASRTFGELGGELRLSELDYPDFSGATWRIFLPIIGMESKSE